MSRRTEPTYYVVVQEEGGEELKLDLTDRVMSVEYKQEEDKADLVTITVRNWDLANFDDPIWKPGNLLFLAFGYPGNLSQQFQAVISSVAGSVELQVEAQGAESKLNRVTRCRTFENMKRSDVVKQLAEEAGFPISTQQIQDTEVICETITQAGLTDAEFLRRLAEIEGFEWFVNDVGEFTFATRRMGGAPDKGLVWYPHADNIERASDAVETGEIIEFSIEADIFFKPKDKAGKITLKSRDPITKEDITEIASEAETVRDKTAPAPLVVDEANAEGVAQKTQVTEDVRSTTQYPRDLVKREADGRFRKQANDTVEISMTIVGDPFMRVGRVVEVLNISKRYSGLYYVKGCTHSLGSGYTTQLLLKSDGVNSVGKVSGAAPTNPKAAQSKAKVNKQKAPPRPTQQLQPVKTPVTPKSAAQQVDEIFYKWGGGKPPFDPNNPFGVP